MERHSQTEEDGFQHLGCSGRVPKIDLRARGKVKSTALHCLLEANVEDVEAIQRLCNIWKQRIYHSVCCHRHCDWLVENKKGKQKRHFHPIPLLLE